MTVKSSHPTGLHFHRRNPDPAKGDHGDCVTRAITLATGQRYDDVFRSLHRWMQCYDLPGTPKGGVPKRIWRQYLRSLGWRWQDAPAGADFKADNLPRLCIAEQAGHLVLVANGSIWDSWDSRGKRRKQLKGWMVPSRSATVASDWAELSASTH